MRKVLVWIVVIALILIGLKVYWDFVKKGHIVVAQIKDDLSEDNLNYVDEPSWLVYQALKLLSPPLIEYKANCYPYSKILSEIPSKENNLMFQQDQKTVIILLKKNLKMSTPINVFITLRLLNLDVISNKWVYINVAEAIDSVQKIGDEDVRITYKTALSLPYFPFPILFDGYEQYEQEILSYKINKNFTKFPRYSQYDLLTSQSNIFVVSSKKTRITFKNYLSVENFLKDLPQIDLARVPTKLKIYISRNLPQNYKIITLPDKEMYFIFFNPNLSKETRMKIYLAFLQELQKYDLRDYQITTSYILPYHFASYSLKLQENIKVVQNKQNQKKQVEDLKVLIAYTKSTGKEVSSLISEIFTKYLNSDTVIVNLEKELPKRSIFGFEEEKPEPLIKYVIQPYNFDLIISPITFTPYMNYYLIYSKQGKYNIFSVSNNKIEDLLNQIMQGFDSKQKDLLIQLQKELEKQFLIVPIMINTQTFVLNKSVEEIIKVGPTGIDIP
ncbi:MAG: hypothetical protein ABDH21_00260 [bacterium]